jgi:hypothetical protein
MRQIEIVVLMMAVLVGWGNGQTYEASVQMSVTSEVLNVDLYLATTGGTSALLSDATLTITYNTSALTYIGKNASYDGRWDNGSSTSYNDLSSSNVVPKASLDVTRTLDGAGLDIPTTATRVGRIQFTVTNANANPTILWKMTMCSITSVGGSLDDMLTGTTFVDPDDIPLPITLASFTASMNAAEGGVKLAWKTASEVDNYGYTVQRKSDREYADLAGSFIAGKGTTVEPQSYSYVDRSIAGAGTYTYRLKQQDTDGAVHYTQSVVVTLTLADVPEVAPREFRLAQNYPNPFNPSTKVKFSVESTERAVVKVYTMLGEEVLTLYDGVAEAGRYYVATFDASRLASGIYFYRLTTDSKTDVKKMLLVK